MKNNSGRSMQALALLNKAGDKVSELLDEFSKNGAGQVEISEILKQIQHDIYDARERAGTETIRLGILGGRGSGKSTFANALIGEALLPESAIVFCTSIPTTIKYAVKYHVEIESDIEENNVDEVTDSSEYIRNALRKVCKESENQDNVKQITKISLGVPNFILDGKEIVDVPGFTKGNALHQAFAEKYAKYYCDLCLVLINNSESVEINGEGGLAALCSTFRNRLESTVFIINKADQSLMEDLNYIKKQLRKNFDDKDVTVYVISSKNSLSRDGVQFEMSDLFSYISYLSGRKLIILVRALLQRLTSNFATLSDLCKLSTGTLGKIEAGIQNLIKNDFPEAEIQLRKGIAEKSTIPKDISRIDTSKFILPHPLIASGAYEYANQILDALSESGAEVLADHVQNQQAKIFRDFSEQFEEQIAVFESKIRVSIKDFERKFGVNVFVDMPSIKTDFKVSAFNPAKIEKIKPAKFYVWAEKSLPKILARDLKFWASPVTVKFPLGISATFKLPLPIGIKTHEDALNDLTKDVLQRAYDVMNSYIFECISAFVRELWGEYEKGLNNYVDEWKRCLSDCDKKIKVAQGISEPDSLKKLNSIVHTLEGLLNEVNGLAVPQ
jgi:hypothetical protein